MEYETKQDIIELSQGYFGAILLAVLMYSGVVSGLYAGESITFETNLTNPYYTVVGNSSDLEGLNISLENGNITISTVVNYKPDNFTLIFFNKVTREVEKIVYTDGGGSSGGGGTKYVDRNLTVYVTEYIDKIEVVNNTEFVDNTETIETGYELWHIILGLAVGGLFGWWIIRNEKMEEEKIEEEEEKEEEDISS